MMAWNIFQPVFLKPDFLSPGACVRVCVRVHARLWLQLGLHCRHDRDALEYAEYGDELCLCAQVPFLSATSSTSTA